MPRASNSATHGASAVSTRANEVGIAVSGQTTTSTSSGSSPRVSSRYSRRERWSRSGLNFISWAMFACASRTPSIRSLGAENDSAVAPAAPATTSAIEPAAPRRERPVAGSARGSRQAAPSASAKPIPYTPSTGARLPIGPSVWE